MLGISDSKRRVSKGPKLLHGIALLQDQDAEKVAGSRQRQAAHTRRRPRALSRMQIQAIAAAERTFDVVLTEAAKREVRNAQARGRRLIHIKDL
ncbi:hypothetical protein ACIKT0_12280 [Hansschlegelia beijingensis]|uniref:hypothetical protein n=1 Tax=Hansschlegelia beijingensis TaxID=1133344 RepID=UPI00387F294A